MSYKNTYFSQEELDTMQTANFSKLLSISYDFVKNNWLRLFLVPSLIVSAITGILVLGGYFSAIAGVVVVSIKSGLQTGSGDAFDAFLENRPSPINAFDTFSSFLVLGIIILFLYFFATFVASVLSFRSLEIMNNSKMKDIFDSKRMYWNVFGLVGIYLVGIIALLIIGLVFVAINELFVVPFYVVAILWAVVIGYVGQILVFENNQISEAFRQGFELVKTNILSIILRAVLLNLLIGVGSFGFFVALGLVTLLFSSLSTFLGVIVATIGALALIGYSFAIGFFAQSFTYINFLNLRLKMLEKSATATLED